MHIDYSLILLFTSNIIALFVAVWKLSQWEGRLQNQINQNRKDINAGLNALRIDMERRDHDINIQLNTLIKYIEKTTDYCPPKVNDFDVK